MINFVVDGDPQAPVLVLGSSIGTSYRIWDPQLPGLVQDFRVLRFDLPGHDGWPIPAGPCDVPSLAAQVLEVVDHLSIETFAYCGVSMGGAIGQQLALDHPGRVSKLVLVCTSAHFGPSPQPCLERAARVRLEGTNFLVELARGRWFGLDAPVPPHGRELLEAQESIDPEGYAACCEALAAFDLRDDLGRIQVPTRVIAGERDLATPVVMAEELAKGIPGADLVVLPGAAHLAGVEQPAAVLQAMRQHLRD